MEPYHKELSGKAWSMWQHHIPQNIFLNLGLADSRILHFWQVLESLHKFIIELHALQCLFVRGSNKKQSRGRIISNFISYINKVIILQCGPLLAPFQKMSFFPLQFGQEDNIFGNSIERRILKIDIVLPVPTGRVGIGWWTLL